jgi:hypothetical protein
VAPCYNSMATLAKEIGDIGNCSVLLRRAKRLSINSVRDYIRLAVARGCRHYAPSYPPADFDPGVEAIADEELVALLLLGENEFEPVAVRCAAQLAGRCNLEGLARVAKQERIGRVLSYISEAGSTHDSTNKDFWLRLRALLGEQDPIANGVLPHWSRFVSQTGVIRNGGGDVKWLHRQ